MPASAFLDTNVLLYAFDRSEPAKRDIALALLSREDSSYVVSAQVLSEFYVNAVAKLGKPLSAGEAASAIEDLSRLPTVSVDAALVASATAICDESAISYWDALIVAAARFGGCERLLTEDLNDGEVVVGVRIENPFR